MVSVDGVEKILAQPELLAAAEGMDVEQLMARIRERTQPRANPAPASAAPESGEDAGGAVDLEQLFAAQAELNLATLRSLGLIAQQIQELQRAVAAIEARLAEDREEPDQA